MNDPRQEELRRRLYALGFDEVRFAAAEAPLTGEGLGEWLAAGMHADMHWMERTAVKRLDPRQVLAGVRSIIVLGVSYAGGPERAAAGARWARYALHEDYHDTMKRGLIAAGSAIEELFGLSRADYRYYTDTGPVLERSWAARAGVGFVGKNAMLISRQHGNWLLLGAILSPLEFAPDAPLRKTHAMRPAGDAAVGLLCGKCTRCLDACPTDAFPRPGVVDARRCISYQTIENPGAIPRELRAGIGEHVFGCDVCLEVCPWNRFARRGREMLLVVRGEIARLSIRELLEMTPERFAQAFRRTPIKRLKLPRLLRNACIVAANSGDADLLPSIVPLAAHERALVRAHAVWAVFQLAGAARARELLAAARAAENEPDVLAEYAAAESPGGSRKPGGGEITAR